MVAPTKITGKRPRKTIYLGDPLLEPPSPELADLLEPFRGSSDCLVSVLQALQQKYGYLPERTLHYTARELGVPLARLYGVATFYNQFLFTPPGRVQLQVCCGTPCHVAGAPALVDELKSQLQISENETTVDGMFTLQTVFCVGCCSLAPVMIINQEVNGRMSPARIPAILEKYKTLHGEVSQ